MGHNPSSSKVQAKGIRHARSAGCPFFISGKEGDMRVSKRLLVLAAQDIRHQLQVQKERRYNEVRQRLAHFIDRVEQLKSFKRKLWICETHGWKVAAAKTVKNVETIFHDVPYLLPEINRVLNSCAAEIPPLRDIYQELIQSDGEFEELQYSSKEGVLSVTIEPIQLEGVYLGEFEIQLHISRLGGVHSNEACRIVALDPHPAVGNELVTHPHVSEERLCAGDGDASIQAALSSGRICDFFTIVRSILTTYNKSSPYIHLSEWDGRQCAECSIWVNNDEVYYCHGCEVDLCNECAFCCSICEETNCLSCLQTCPQCEEMVCRGCIKNCPECGETLCSHCVDEGKCPCSQTDEEEESDEQEQEENSDSGEDQKNTIQVCAEGFNVTEQTENGPSHPASAAAG